jgi:hypothetical protein
VLRRHVKTGLTSGVIPRNGAGRRLALGWAPDDPLLHVSLTAIAREAGYPRFRGPWQGQVRAAVEEAVATVDAEQPWGRNAAHVDRADGGGQVSWTLPLAGRAVRDLAGFTKTACVLVVAAVSGMRASEIMELHRGCATRTEDAGGVVRYRLTSRIAKGQPLGGTVDEWVVTEAVYRAVSVAADLLDGDDPDAVLFGRFGFDTMLDSFRRWVNGPEGRRLGLMAISDGPVSLRMLRRTLAIELAYRPGGLLAAKIHLRAHLGGRHRRLRPTGRVTGQAARRSRRCPVRSNLAESGLSLRMILRRSDAVRGSDSSESGVRIWGTIGTREGC